MPNLQSLDLTGFAIRSQPLESFLQTHPRLVKLHIIEDMRLENWHSEDRSGGGRSENGHFLSKPGSIWIDSKGVWDSIRCHPSLVHVKIGYETTPGYPFLYLHYYKGLVTRDIMSYMHPNCPIRSCLGYMKTGYSKLSYGSKPGNPYYYSGFVRRDFWGLVNPGEETQDPVDVNDGWVGLPLRSLCDYLRGKGKWTTQLDKAFNRPSLHLAAV